MASKKKQFQLLPCLRIRMSVLLSLYKKVAVKDLSSPPHCMWKTEGVLQSAEAREKCSWSIIDGGK